MQVISFKTQKTNDGNIEKVLRLGIERYRINLCTEEDNAHGYIEIHDKGFGELLTLHRDDFPEFVKMIIEVAKMLKIPTS